MKVLLALLISFNSLANINYDDLQYESKYQIGNTQVNEDDIVDFKPVRMKAGISVGASCGQMSAVSNIKAGVEKAVDVIKSKEFRKTVLRASPLLFACAYDDVTCAAMQNINQFGSFVADFNLKLCSVIDKYTTGKANEYRQNLNSCIGNLQKQGHSFVKAKEFCTSSMLDKIASISGDSHYVKQVNIVDDTMKYLGINDKEINKNIKKHVGETTISLGVIEHSFNNTNSKPVNILNAQNELTVKITKKLCKSENIYKTYFSDSSIKKVISNSFSGNTMAQLSTLNTAIRQSYCKRVVETSVAEYYDKTVSKMYAILSMGLTNPKLTERTKEQLLLKVKMLESYLNIRKVMKKETSHSIAMKINSEEKYFEKTKSTKLIKTQEAIFENDNSEESYPEECIYSASC